MLIRFKLYPLPSNNPTAKYRSSLPDSLRNDANKMDVAPGRCKPTEETLKSNKRRVFVKITVCDLPDT